MSAGERIQASWGPELDSCYVTNRVLNNGVARSDRKHLVLPTDARVQRATLHLVNMMGERSVLHEEGRRTGIAALSFGGTACCSGAPDTLKRAV